MSFLWRSRNVSFDLDKKKLASRSVRNALRTLGDRDTLHETVQLLVVAERALDVARRDARLFVVERGVASQLGHLGDLRM